MTELVKKLTQFLTRDLWHIDLSSLDKFKAFMIQVIRLIYTVIREFNERELSLRAMSLVYTSLLSLIPLIALAFSILKAFGVVDTQLEPILHKFLVPLGPQGAEVSQKILEFVKNTKVGVLGIVGLLLLIYTVISVINKLESSLNHIWRIKKGRSISRIFSDYLSIILMGPVLVFALFGLTSDLLGNTILQKISSLGPIGAFITLSAGKVLSLIIIMAIFTFVYIAIPNVRVHVRSAVLGGFIAGITWQVVGWAFATFVATSASYAAIYSGFAVLILFMIWVYLSWLILLIGCEVSYCHQNLKILSIKEQAFKLTHRLEEKLALLIMYLIGYNFYHNKQRWTLNSLVDHLELPQQHIQECLIHLEDQKLISETGDKEPAYLPAKSIDMIKLSEIIGSVRDGNKGKAPFAKDDHAVPEIDEVSGRIDDAIYSALGEESLRDIIISKNDIK
jgi:membrane protein